MPGYVRTPMTAVNTFNMPFLMDADVFANKFLIAVARKSRFCIIPVSYTHLDVYKRQV